MWAKPPHVDLLLTFLSCLSNSGTKPGMDRQHNFMGGAACPTGRSDLLGSAS